MNEGRSPYHVGQEHCDWERAGGAVPREVVASVGFRWSAEREPEWEDAELVIGMAWWSLIHEELQACQEVEAKP